MTTKEYLEKEQKMLEIIVNIYNSNVRGKVFTEILKSVAKDINRKMDGIVLIKDELSPDTEGADEKDLIVLERDKENVEYIDNEIEERETMEIIGHKSFLPLLFSEYTLWKNNITYC